MAEPAAQTMTVAEFLQWDDGSDTRYELVGGIPRAMTPPSGSHRTIVSNVTGLVHAALRSRRPCRGENEAGIRIDERTWWQADIAVTCREPAPETLEPQLVVEVLLPNTRLHDLGRKLGDYKALASVQEIWMVDGERRWIQVWKRLDGTWSGLDFVGNAMFASEVLGTTLPFDEIYQDSGL